MRLTFIILQISESLLGFFVAVLVPSLSLTVTGIIPVCNSNTLIVELLTVAAFIFCTNTIVMSDDLPALIAFCAGDTLSINEFIGDAQFILFIAGINTKSLLVSVVLLLRRDSI